VLRRIDLFRDLNTTLLCDLEHHGSWRVYRRNDLIAYPGRHAQTLCAIVQGCAREYRVSTTGQEITLDLWEAGEVYGLAFIDLPMHPPSVLESHENGTVVYHLPPSRVRRLLDSHAHVSAQARRALAWHLAHAHDQAEELGLYDAGPRLARLLHRLARKSGDPRIMETHAALAACIGVRQDEVTKILKRFQREGLILKETRRRGITILDLRRLAERGGITE
jgi:CRP-like cAMP-binding protein